MKVAITGGIGSGKSYVCALLAKRGIDVYDCDAAAKRLIRTMPEIKEALTNLIGANTYTPDGKLNKAAVAQFLLTSETNAKAIDAIVHPAVARDFTQSGMEWMECAILYESGFDKLVEHVVAVTAPEEVRMARVAARDNISIEKAREWMARQWPQEAVRQRADFEIINDGKENVERQIDDIINKLQATKCYRQS